jgi:HlyD family secretion protein
MKAFFTAFSMSAGGSTAEDWQSSDPWVRTGMRVVIWLFGGLLLFSALVSISGAVVTAGTVNVEGNYQTVQHLDGGIVEKILVKNGDMVEAGDLLVKLDATQTRASLDVTRARLAELLIQRARLEAERDDKDSYELPAAARSANKETDRIAAAQKSLFDARRAAHKGERSVLKQRIDQLKGERAGLQAQAVAVKKQREINKRELASVMPLFEKGFVNQQRIAPLQREHARLEGEEGRVAAEIAKNASTLAETELRVAQVDKNYVQEVTDELRKVLAGLAEQEETLKAQADKVQRTEIRAPRSGHVHALSVHTEGGVITAASPILQIIPDGGKLVVDSQLPTQEIDKVRKGQKAIVLFPAFNARETPRIEGHVTKVSPAEVADKDGRRYYTVQTEISATELAKLGKGHQLVPGMPAEVYIETTPRTILSYFLKPLTDAMSRALREG